MQKEFKMTYDAMLNETLNDCDIATDIGPKEIEYDYPMYCMVYRIPS
jgi:hypothetical protein